MIKVSRLTDSNLNVSVAWDDDGFDIEVYGGGVYNLSADQLTAVVEMGTKLLGEM